MDVFSYKEDAYIRIKGKPWLAKSSIDDCGFANLKKYLQLTSLFPEEDISTRDENVRQ